MAQQQDKKVQPAKEKPQPIPKPVRPPTRDVKESEDTSKAKNLITEERKKSS